MKKFIEQEAKEKADEIALKVSDKQKAKCFYLFIFTMGKLGFGPAGGYDDIRVGIQAVMDVCLACIVFHNANLLMPLNAYRTDQC